MATQTKRTTIYLDPDLHKALRLKAVALSRSVSELVNDAVKEWRHAFSSSSKLTSVSV